jgi:hypothetical protein
MRNTSCDIEHYDYKIDYRSVGIAAAEHSARVRRQDDVELTVAISIVHAVAKTLTKFRQFCCAVEGCDYIENLTFADPICIHWQVHIEGAIRSHRRLTSPQDLTLTELARTLHQTNGGIDVSAPETNAVGDPAFVIRHCEGSAHNADVRPAPAVAALLLSGPTVDAGQSTTASASTLATRLTYDRRIISHNDVLGFVAALNHNLRSTTRS